MLKIIRENLEDLLGKKLWLALPAEYIGTLAITLLGCGAWQATVNVVHIALAFGLTVATMVWVFHHISGGNFNPAVTIATILTRRVTFVRGVLYIAVQIAGGVTGAGILYGLENRNLQYGLGVNQLSPGVGPAQGFGVELLVTFVYVLAVFASGDQRRPDLKGSAPLNIGLAVIACHLFAIPYTRAGMNPARSFGPALILGTWKQHWVFWVGPVAGSVLAGLLYEYIFSAGATCSGVKKCLQWAKPSRKQTEQDKAPLEEEEDKEGIFGIDDESRVDGEQQQQLDGENVDVEKGKEKE